jgi:hypothetical protein
VGSAAGGPVHWQAVRRAYQLWMVRGMASVIPDECDDDAWIWGEGDSEVQEGG